MPRRTRWLIERDSTWFNVLRNGRAVAVGLTEDRARATVKKMRQRGDVASFEEPDGYLVPVT